MASNYKLIYLRAFYEGVDDILDYIALDKPLAATHVGQRIYDSVQKLRDFPRIGHVGDVPGTYEFIPDRLPYIIVYQVNDQHEKVVITKIFHARQERED